MGAGAQLDESMAKCALRIKDFTGTRRELGSVEMRQVMPAKLLACVADNWAVRGEKDRDWIPVQDAKAQY
jgi:hypothetical protein